MNSLWDTIVEEEVKPEISNLWLTWFLFLKRVLTAYDVNLRAPTKMRQIKSVEITYRTIMYQTLPPTFAYVIEAIIEFEDHTVIKTPSLHMEATYAEE